MGTGVSLPRDKRPGSKADRSTPASAHLKNGSSSFLQSVCLRCIDWNKFTLTLPSSKQWLVTVCFSALRLSARLRHVILSLYSSQGESGWRNWCSDWVTVWTVHGSNPRCFLPPQKSKPTPRTTMSPIQWVQMSLLGVKRLQREVTRLHLSPRLRMHVFFAWTVITLHLPFIYKQSTEKCTINTISVW